jgi:murein DD-endopeptidase MepM/ murein hydrolase activator NlpD
VRKVFLSFCAAFLLGSPVFADERESLPFTFEGQWVQGGLIRAQIEAGSKVSVDGRSLTLDETGKFIFGFDRDYEKSTKVDVTAPDGTSWSGVLDVASRKYDIQYVEGIASKYVEPPVDTLARIRAEGQKKRAARGLMSKSEGFFADFSWPLVGRISGVYGSQRFYNGTPKRPHFGVDVAAPSGTFFKAPASGVVTLADEDMYYEGGLIFLDHGMGLVSAFLHLSGVDVKIGDVVEKGQVLGRVGAAGRANGPHLDWRMYWYDQHIDPATLVGPMPKQED